MVSEKPPQLTEVRCPDCGRIYQSDKGEGLCVHCDKIVVWGELPRPSDKFIWIDE